MHLDVFFTRHDMCFSSTLKCLEDAVNSNNYYEAHQIYITISRRLISKKRYEDAQKILLDGIRILSEAKHFQSASDLSMKLTGTFHDEWKPKYTEICSEALRCIHMDKTAHSFVEKVLRLSKTMSPSGNEDKDLHYNIANIMVGQGSYEEAIIHYVEVGSQSINDHIECLVKLFVRDGDQGPLFSELLLTSVLRYLLKKYHQEAYLVIVGVILKLSELNLLSLESYQILNSVYDNKTEHCVLLETKIPLVNFSQLLILTLQRSLSHKLFEELKSQYEVALNDKLKHLLKSVESVYYKTQNNHGIDGAGISNVISNLLSGILSGTQGENSSSFANLEPAISSVTATIISSDIGNAQNGSADGNQHNVD